MVVRYWVIVYAFLSSADFFSKAAFSKNPFKDYHRGIKQIGSRSGPTFCRASSGS